MSIARVVSPFLCALFAAGAAHANISIGVATNPCVGMPTVTQCGDPAGAYLAQCPAQQSACQAVMQSAFTAYGQSLPSQRNALAPPGTYQAGSVVPTNYAPFSYTASSSTVSGVATGYYGSSLNHQAYVLNPSQNGRIAWTFAGRKATLIHLDPQAAWDSDGSAVSSCEEYAYKRYYSYSTLQDQMAQYGDDWTTIAEIIYFYAGQQLLYGTVTDELGNPTASWSWPARNPTLFDTAFINRGFPLQTFQWDLSVYDFIQGMLSDYTHGIFAPQPVDPNAQFNLLATQVSRFGEDLLEQRYQSMKSLYVLFAERDQIYNDYMTAYDTNNCTAPQGPAQTATCNWAKVVATGEIYKVDSNINQTLLNAFNDSPNTDCFRNYETNSCTLSPHQVVDEMYTSINTQREADYAQCMLITGDNFGTGSLMSLAQQGLLTNITPSFIGFTSSSSALHAFLGEVQAAVQNIQLPIDPATGATILGDKKSDSGSFGSSLFGASYAYEAGWAVTNIAPLVCNGNLQVKGALNVIATIMGQSLGDPGNLSFGAQGGTGSKPNLSVVDFLAEVKSSASGLAYQGHLIILGNSLYSAAGNAATTFDITQPDTESSSQLMPPATFFFAIGPIPISIYAGLQGGIGYSSSLQGDLNRDCPDNAIAFAAAGVISPYAHVDAYIQAALGIPSVLAAGIRGTLTLARVDLPLTLNASITGNSAQGMFFNGSSNLNLRMSTFGGKVVVFLDSLFYSIEATLVEWPGLVTDVNLFHLNFDNALALITLKLSESGGEEADPLGLGN